MRCKHGIIAKSKCLGLRRNLTKKWLQNPPTSTISKPCTVENVGEIKNTAKLNLGHDYKIVVEEKPQVNIDPGKVVDLQVPVFMIKS